MPRLLVVEDQSIVRQGIIMMLQQHKDLVVVGEAADGKEAIRLLEKMHIDLVVMDIRMPEMNGIEATRVIRKRWPLV